MAILVYRIVLTLAALILVVNAIKTVQVFQLYGAEPGTQFWFVLMLIGVSSALGAICILLMGVGWAWSVWIWAVAILGLAVAGWLIGLNPEIVTRWDVALPWIVLALATVIRSRFACMTSIAKA